MPDLALIETGSGGDLVLAGADLLPVDGTENLPYLSTFGGADWWANTYLSREPSLQFGAQTERTLEEVSLTGAGRLRIEAAIKADLQYIEQKIPGTSVSLRTALNVDRIDILITINGRDFAYQWSPTAGLTTA